ncbi:MAG: hypothetical protein QOH26_1277, partial [Actinomycetota bacterium]|nr:hypothetical protein [Actinomycetota bacterium]
LTAAAGFVLTSEWPWTVSHCCPHLDNWWQTFIRLLTLPLQYLRFKDHPGETSGGTPSNTQLENHPVAIGVGILNLLMLFFSLSAIRRVTKAE